jgi:hypothetical protein
MVAVPRDPEAGVMTVLGVRIPDADRDALVELARKKDVKRPELIREMMRWAIARWTAELEAEAELARTGPPDGGG